MSQQKDQKISNEVKRNIPIKEILSRGVTKIIDKDKLEKRLLSRKKLRIKHGVDPTTPDLHLGQAAILEKLRIFQSFGHKIIFLIGDFTGRFGDPTEKLKTRRLRSKREVRAIARGYLTQVSKILDLRKMEVRYNSEWYDKMHPEEFIKLFSYFTAQRMLERDMFQERIRKGEEIRLHEPLYPVLQAYDSVVLRSDLTVIGQDQFFNELQARKLQENFGQEPQSIIAMKMLIGTDGVNKMSQSLGNYIGILESPRDQYGKIMSIPDHLLFDYFKLVTRISFQELNKIKRLLGKKKINPRDLKARLAKEIVTIYHSPTEARRAEKEFNLIFREHRIPSEIPTLKLKKGTYPILDLLVRLKLTPSKSEAKRLILSSAVKVNGKSIRDWSKNIDIKEGMIIQIGKRHFAKIKI